MFTSLQFTPGRTSPPDARPLKCWQANPRLCTGIVLFDMLIGNDDRGPWNLVVDDPESPKEIIVYDHDCAIASDMFGDARKRLSKVNDFLADNHCLIPFVTTDEYFPEWVGRIGQIPAWFIDDVCMEARTKGFVTADARAAGKFLKWRSKHFGTLVNQHKSRFTGIKVWSVIL